MTAMSRRYVWTEGVLTRHGIRIQRIEQNIRGILYRAGFD